jgi:two-component system response regulator VanR
MSIRILLVEDDEHIAGAVKAFLTEAGYEVDACPDGDEAYARFYEGAYQLVILDVMLPGIDGHGLLKEFRKLNNTPVLMMTALSDDENQIRAFDAGADDYVTKPFRIRLLLKRVEALLRRSGALAKEIRHGKLTILPEEFKASYDGEELPLTLKEFEILSLLAQNRGRTQPYETILSRIWGYDFDGDCSAVHTHVKNLRAKLPENIIRTVRGIGYRFEGCAGERAEGQGKECVKERVKECTGKCV